MSVSVWTGKSTIDDYNVANGNWTRMNDILGTDLDFCGEMACIDLADFRMRILLSLDLIKHTPRLDAGTPDVQSTFKGGGRVINCGLPEGYWTSRLGALLKLVDLAISTGQPLQWG